MAADRVGRLLPALVGASTAMASLPALAQGILDTSLDGTAYYDGGLFRYRLGWEGSANPIDRVELSLSSAMELVEIRDDDGLPLLSAAYIAAICSQSGSPPIWTGCPPIILPTDPPYSVGLQSSGSGQLINLNVPPNTTKALQTIQIVTRVHAQPSCSETRAAWVNLVSGWLEVFTKEDLVIQSACQGPMSLSLTVPAIETQRRSPETWESLGLTAEVNGVSTVVNEAAYRCRPDGGVFGSCDDPAFSDWIRFSQVTTYPVTLAAQVVNHPNPPQTEWVGEVEITASAAPATITQIRVVEQAVDPYVLSGPSALGPGDLATIEIAGALNAQGGEEPRVALWEIAAMTPDDPTILADVQGFLPASASTALSQSLQITVPSDFRLPFTVPSVTVTVRAHRTLTAPAAGASQGTWSFEVTGSPFAAYCRIGSTDTGEVPVGPVQVGVRARRGFELQASNDGTSFVAVPADEWLLAPGDGELEVSADNVQAVYVAPVDPTSETITAMTSLCSTDPTVAVEVRHALSVRLTSDLSRLQPGDVTRLRGDILNLADETQNGVRVRLRLDAGLAALFELPRPITGFEPRPTSIGDTGVATAVPAAMRTLEFELDVPAGEQRFVLPIMARSMLPGRAKAAIEVFYPVSAGAPLEPVAADRVVIEIDADPELTEATLVGKVFHDENGDGLQQPGEQGLPKVMVALSSGVYALTDEQGRYHIPRLSPGRHAVKIDPGTLPLGAALTTDERREVTLTPGGFTKVSFGVALPDIRSGKPLTLVTSGSFAAIAGGEPIYRARFRLEPGDSLTAFNGEARVEAQVDASGEAVVDLPLDVREAHWILAQRSIDGRSWFSSFAVFAYRRREGGSLIAPWGPRPLGALVLPPQNSPVNSMRLAITGQVRTPLNLTVSAAGASACDLTVERVEQDGSGIRCDIVLHEPLAALSLTFDPAPDALGDDPPAQRIALPVQVDPTVHFLVALAGVEASAVIPRDSADDPTWWDAGGAFFYRGVIKGSILITAGADARARDVLLNANGELRPASRIGGRLLAHDVRRIFRDLDPEAYYPVYGDSSVTVDERESGGRFFVRIEAEQSYLKWGGINTAIDDATVGRYVRSLYGLGGRLALGESDDALRLRATAFAAQPETLAARDELVVTGGTLYFLGHKEVVEGSLRVTVELVDEISGLAVRATPLVEGADYEADYAGGRIILDTALPYRTFGTSITADDSGGRRARLMVEYEYLPFGDPTNDWSIGARLVGGVGPVSVGLTGVTELLGLEQGIAKLDSRYTLLGAGLHLDLGEPLRLRLEFAHSDGGSHESGRSVDGGLTFGPRSVANGRSGSAAAVELSTGLPGAEAAVYGRFIEAGYADSRAAAGRELLQGGARIAASLPSRTRVWGNYDYRETDPDEGPSAIRQIGLLGAGQSYGDLSVSFEGRHEAVSAANRTRTLAGAEVGYRLTPTWSISLRRRQLVAADAATEEASASGETAAGMLLENGSGWQLGGEVGLTDDADAFGRMQGSMPVTADTEVYASYAVASHLGVGLAPAARGQHDGVVVGGRRLLDDGTLLYSEQSLRLDGKERRLTRTVGGQLPLTDKSALSVAYERGSVSSDDLVDRSLSRDAAAITGTLAGDKLSARLSVDGRVDRRPGNRDALLGAQGRVDLRATEELTLAVAARGAHTLFGENARRMQTGRVAWEGALGAAWRPIETDWINAFCRYAIVHERDRGPADDPAFAGWLNQTSHVVAVALVVDVIGPVAVSPKVAFRATRARIAGDEVTDRGLVTVLRGDLHLSKSWDASLEGRACAAPGSDLDTELGALAELSMLMMEWLRVGAGYNLSSISAQSVRCDEPGARGLFVRAEVVY